MTSRDPSPRDPRDRGPDDTAKQNIPDGTAPEGELSGAMFRFDWDTLALAPLPVVDPVRAELGLPQDVEPVAGHLAEELREALEGRIPERLFNRALITILGTDGNDRLVAALEFRRRDGSLVPPVELLDSPEPRDPGEARRPSGGASRRPVLKTVIGTGAGEAADWEEVAGRLTIYATQRFASQWSDGFTVEFGADSSATVHRLWQGIEVKERSEAPVCARYLLDRAVARQLKEMFGVDEERPDYISVSPLVVGADGGGTLTVVLAVQLGDGRYHAIEGRNVHVGLSPGKLVVVRGGEWRDRGLAEQYVERPRE